RCLVILAVGCRNRLRIHRQIEFLQIHNFVFRVAALVRDAFHPLRNLYTIASRARTSCNDTDLRHEYDASSIVISILGRSHRDALSSYEKRAGNTNEKTEYSS